MGQEFFINSNNLQDKVRELLPSQGGSGAGFDLSASTQIIPIIDLTESAEGSNFRADLQSSLSFSSITSFDINNTTTTIVNNTGYFRVFGNYASASGGFGRFELSDGASTKIVIGFSGLTSQNGDNQFDFIVFLKAGDFLQGVCNASGVLSGSTRQLASIDGTLVNP
jgi:hypothetical protein